MSKLSGILNQMDTEEIEKTQSFEEEVRKFIVTEIPTEFPPEAVNSTKDQLGKSHLMLLGEWHGIKENPNIIYTFMKKFNLQGLGLEWTSDQMEVIQEFLNSGKIDMEKIDKFKDGRVTAGHFALFKKLQEEGMLKKLILFCVWDKGSWDNRDKGMADNILEGRDVNISTLIVAGDAHTNTKIFKNNPSLPPDMTHPMGYHLIQSISSIPVWDIIPGSGEQFSRTIKTIPTQNVDERVNFLLKDDDKFSFVLPVAHAAIVP